MKIYWLMSTEWGKCFFTNTREETQSQVDFRNKESTCNGIWSVFEEELPDDKFGWCINGLPWQEAPAITLPYRCDCSVGMVRKMRNGIEDDDGTCNTCPYFSKEKPEVV